MNTFRKQAAAVASLWLGGTLTSAFAADAVTPVDPHEYQQVAWAVLQAEAPPLVSPGTVFVSFADAEVSPFIPALQALYPTGTVLKGEGSDGTWDGSSQRLVDRTTGQPAIAVFISAAKPLADGDVAFAVTTQTSAGGSYNSLYRFHHEGDAWWALSRVASTTP